jgi:ribokinase
MYDVITVGSATLDVFTQTNVNSKNLLVGKTATPHLLFPLGEKVLINELDFMIGGGGTNTAVNFSRLGLHTGFLGCIGKDDNAKSVLEMLHLEQVDFLGQQKDKTGYSVILDSAAQDRTILTFKGSNNKLDTKFVLEHTPKTKWLYASSMIGGSFVALCTLIQKLHKDGVKIAFNPSSYQAKKGYTQLKPILDCCDVLTCNLEEAQMLFEHEGKPHHLKNYLKEHSKTYVVITNGAEGATLYYNGKTYHQKPSGTLPVVETTGAGDAFASTFVAGLIHGLAPSESLHLAMVQSESVISAVGAKNHLLTKEVLFAKVRATKKVNQYTTTDAKAFKLSNGVVMHSLEELAYYLDFIDDATFTHHVTQEKNDFANWTKDVFDLGDLASDLEHIGDKGAMSAHLRRFLEGAK